MPSIVRLNKLLSVAARYRLDEFAKGVSGAGYLGAMLLPWRARWLFDRRSRGDRNRRLRLALEELGPIFVKFGQLLSTRRDFIAAALADELRSLQDQVPPFLSPRVDDIVAAALGKPVDEVFATLESRPFASASVAQVHHATLRDGSEVVVKVLRPGIGKTVAADLKLLRVLAWLIEAVVAGGKRLRPLAVVADYEKVIHAELDLRAEGANTAQLRRNFAASPDLHVPRVHWAHTRRNILVMERIHGIAVTDVEELRACGIPLAKLAETGVRVFFTQVLEHNFFHADMHPGNVFVARDRREQPQYIAVDCAIIGSLTAADQAYLARTLLAVFQRDYRQVAALHIDSGWVAPATRPHELEAAVRTVCEPIFERPLGEISFGRVLLELFRVAEPFGMAVQPQLVLLQKTLLNVEGLGRMLYPQLDLWQTALPQLQAWHRQRLSPLTLLARWQESAPDWLERLPMLPQLALDALERAGKGEDARVARANGARCRQQLREARRRRQRCAAGFALLALAALALVPAVGAWFQDTIGVAGALGLAGLFLLYFGR